MVIKAEEKKNKLTDTQSSADAREIPINKVGIKNIRHPVNIKSTDNNIQATVANFTMAVNLADNVRGTHMSRFVDLLGQFDTLAGIESFKRLLRDTTKELGSESGYVKIDFPFFLKKSAPVTGVESMLDYEATLTGEFRKGSYKIFLKVQAPVTSLCPCSKNISDYGAHNQRSHVTVEVETTKGIWLEELVKLIEKHASCEVYGILKRPDEKYVTEKAYDNPKFVEDLVRDIALELNEDKRISMYSIESENFESIHNHSAYAYIEKDKRKDISTTTRENITFLDMSRIKASSMSAKDK